MTLTDIANVALESLGADSINSIDQESATARKIKRVLFSVIDDVQIIRNWSCLLNIGKLERASKEMIGGEYKYVAPKNLLNIVSQNAQWRRVGRYIMSSSPNLIVEYTASNYQPEQWCKNLQGAVIAKLKAEIVGAIVGNRDLIAHTIQLAEHDINRYMMNDINSSKNVVRQKESSWFSGV